MQSTFKIFKNALNGVGKALYLEQNLRFHFVATTLLIVLGVACRITRMEWFIQLICIGSVISLELANTAIEKLCDVVHPSFNKKIGNIKDMAAGAVFVMVIISIAIGLSIYLPKLLEI